jgi:hypothetical protein
MATGAVGAVLPRLKPGGANHQPSDAAPIVEINFLRLVSQGIVVSPATKINQGQASDHGEPLQVDRLAISWNTIGFELHGLDYTQTA